jgi:hypothetical protein
LASDRFKPIQKTMKKLYTFMSCWAFALVIFFLSFDAAATITIVSPTSSTSVVQCTNIALTTNSSTYVGNGIAELYKGGVLVKTSYVYLNLSPVTNTISAAGLAIGSDYQFKVYDQYNPSNVVWSDFFSIVAISPPSSIALTLSSYTWFEINWSAPSGVYSYRVDVSTTDDFLNILPAYNNYDASGSASGGFYVTGLTEGTTYYTRIRAVNACGTSVNSSTFSTTLPVCTPPAAPTANAAGTIKATSFVASWSAVTGATNGYDVVVTYGASSTTYAAAGTSYTVTALHPSSSYSYRVRAKGCSNSALSNTVNLTTTALGVPVLQGGGGDGDELWRDWTSVEGATSYHYQVSLESDFTPLWHDETPTNSNSSTYGINWCSVYFHRVRAKCAAGDFSAWSEVDTSGPGAGCRVAAPKELTAEAQSNSEITSPEFYPNPADHLLFINTPTEIKELQVLNLHGQFMVVPATLSPNVVQLDVSEMNAGMYIVLMKGKTERYTVKFVRK